MNRITGMICLVIVCCLAAGCETARGFGKDMENTGANMQQGIDKIYHPGE